MSDRFDLLLARLGQRFRPVRQVSCFLGLLQTGKYNVSAAAHLAWRLR